MQITKKQNFLYDKEKWKIRRSLQLLKNLNHEFKLPTKKPQAQMYSTNYLRKKIDLK